MNSNGVRASRTCVRQCARNRPLTFVLADGRRVWSRRLEGLRQEGLGASCATCRAAACHDQFTTVLAPGSANFATTHIRQPECAASARRIASRGAKSTGRRRRARRRPALRRAVSRSEPPPTRRATIAPPFDRRDDPFAWRGDARRGDVTGPSPPPAGRERSPRITIGRGPAAAGDRLGSDRHKVPGETGCPARLPSLKAGQGEDTPADQRQVTPPSSNPHKHSRVRHSGAFGGAYAYRMI